MPNRIKLGRRRENIVPLFIFESVSKILKNQKNSSNSNFKKKTVFNVIKLTEKFPHEFSLLQ